MGAALTLDAVIIRTIHFAQKTRNAKRHVVVLEDFHDEKPAIVSQQIQSLARSIPTSHESVLLVESLSPEHIQKQTILQQYGKQFCQIILSTPLKKTDIHHSLKKHMEENCRQNLVIDNFNALAQNQFLQHAATELSQKLSLVHIDQSRINMEDWLTIGSLLLDLSIYHEIDDTSTTLDPSILNVSMSVDAFIAILLNNFSHLLHHCRQLKAVVKNPETLTMLERYDATIANQLTRLNEVLLSLSPSKKVTEVLYQELQTPHQQPLTALLQFYAQLKEHPAEFNAYHLSVEVSLLHALLVSKKKIPLAIAAAGLHHTSMLRKWLLGEGFYIEFDSYITLPSHCIDINTHNINSYAQKEHEGTFTFDNIIPCHNEHFCSLFDAIEA